MAVYTFEKVVNPGQLHTEIENSGLPNFLYVETVDSIVNVYFSEGLNEQNEDELSSLVNSHQVNNIPIEDIVKSKIQEAMKFGQQIILQFATENVLMGITQANKTAEVSDYLQKLLNYISTGSLYAAIEEVDKLINEGIPQGLAPFVTEERINTYKTKIITFLST